MGYDFLGTMGASQWNRLSSFTSTHIVEMEPTSIYTKHLAAEVKKAQKTQADLKKASDDNFAGFLGDYAFEKDRIPRDTIQYRYNLSDGDTAVLVQTVKTILKPILKRKKDNLEYRYKKFLDLEEQIGLRLNDILGNDNQLPLKDSIPLVMSQIETHFVDGFHTHNLSVDGEKTDKQGMTVHGVTTLKVDQEKTLL